MPRINKDKYNEYMKEYRRKRRLPPDNKTINILDKGLPNLKDKPEIHYYERTGKPITITLRDGSIIYIKKRITQSIIC